MSRRSTASLAASVIIGSAFIVTISNDASAYSSRGIAIYQPGVYRSGVCRGGFTVEPTIVAATMVYALGLR
jgi:hypothetical protein